MALRDSTSKIWVFDHRVDDLFMFSSGKFESLM